MVIKKPCKQLIQCSTYFNDYKKTDMKYKNVVMSFFIFLDCLKFATPLDDLTMEDLTKKHIPPRSMRAMKCAV